MAAALRHLPELQLQNVGKHGVDSDVALWAAALIRHWPGNGGVPPEPPGGGGALV